LVKSIEGRAETAQPEEDWPVEAVQGRAA
jgi:hypothetical protein